MRPEGFEPPLVLFTRLIKSQDHSASYGNGRICFYCAPGWVRTNDPLIKSQVHLPAELRAQIFGYGNPLASRISARCLYRLYFILVFIIIIFFKRTEYVFYLFIKIEMLVRACLFCCTYSFFFLISTTIQDAFVLAKIGFEPMTSRLLSLTMFPLTGISGERSTN